MVLCWAQERDAYLSMYLGSGSSLAKLKAAIQILNRPAAAIYTPGPPYKSRRITYHHSALLYYG